MARRPQVASEAGVQKEIGAECSAPIGQTTLAFPPPNSQGVVSGKPLNRSPSAEKPDDEQENDRSDQRRDQRPDAAATEVNPQSPAKPPADECAHDADNDVDHDPETAAVHDAPCERSCNTANDQPEDDAM